MAQKVILRHTVAHSAEWATVALTVALIVSGCASSPKLASESKDGCPDSYRAAVVWSGTGASASSMDYFDSSVAQVGRTSVPVQGMSNSDQTPGHRGNGRIVLDSTGNGVKDQTHLIDFDPATCQATRTRVNIQSPLNVVPFDDGYLSFNWINGVAQLHHYGPDGTPVALHTIKDWMGMTGLAVGPDAVYAFANYGDKRKTWLLVLDRATLNERKRIPINLIKAEDGPTEVALIGDNLYFPADRYNDPSKDSLIGVINTRTFQVRSIDLGTTSPYLFRTVGTDLYIGHGSLDGGGTTLSVIDTTTNTVTHHDLGIPIDTMDAHNSTLAIGSYTDNDNTATLTIYDLPALTMTGRHNINAPNQDVGLANVIAP